MVVGVGSRTRLVDTYNRAYRKDKITGFRDGRGEPYERIRGRAGRCGSLPTWVGEGLRGIVIEPEGLVRLVLLAASSFVGLLLVRSVGLRAAHPGDKAECATLRRVAARSIMQERRGE